LRQENCLIKLEILIENKTAVHSLAFHRNRTNQMQSKQETGSQTNSNPK